MYMMKSYNLQHNKIIFKEMFFKFFFLYILLKTEEHFMIDICWENYFAFHPASMYTIEQQLVYRPSVI